MKISDSWSLKMNYKIRLVSSVFLFLVFTSAVWGQDNASCFTCHSEPSLTKKTPAGQELSLFVDQKRYEGSVHGSFECITCHQDIQEIPHPEKLQKVDCSSCHTEAVEKYKQG